MLSIPAKVSANKDFMSPLYQYLAETFSEAKAAHFHDSFPQSNMIRERFLQSVQKQKPTEFDVDESQKYLRLLSILQEKFPVGEKVRMRFEWKDALLVNKEVVYHSIKNERAGALFAFSAMISRAALQLGKDKSSKPKQYELCILSASIFEYLRTVYLPANDSAQVSPDLSNEALEMFSTMMLAQAQTVFYNMAKDKGTSKSLLASLALGISELYSKANRISQSEALKIALAPAWGHIFHFNALAYRASFILKHAETVHAKALEEAEGFGLHIAWLRLGLQVANEAIQHGTINNISANQVNSIRALTGEIQKSLTVAVEENRDIYLEPEVNMNTLSLPEGKVTAKINLEKVKPEWQGYLPLDQQEESDPFFGLLPVAVEKAVAAFEVKLREFATDTEQRVTQVIGTTRQTLQDANLPMMIEAGIKSTKGVPDMLYARILTVVQDRGGVMGLRELIDKNRVKNDELKRTLNNLLNKLEAEKQLYNQRKQTYGDRWSIPFSEDSVAPLISECKKLLGFLQEGLTQDSKLEEMITVGEFSGLLKEISLPKEQLDYLLPNDVAVDDDPQVEELRTELRLSYINLEEAIASTEKALGNFMLHIDVGGAQFAEEMSQRPDISRLVENTAELDDAIAIKLTTFSEMVGQITNLSENLNPLLSKVLDDSSKYMQSRQNTSASQQHVQVLKRLEMGIAKFDEMANIVSAGANFYNGLAQKVEKVGGNIEDHLMSIKLISDELVEALNKAPAQRQRPPQQQMQPYQQPPVQPHQQPPMQPQYMPRPQQPQQSYYNPPAYQPQPYSQPPQYHPQPQPGYGYGYGYPPPQPQPGYGYGYPPQGGMAPYQQPPQYQYGQQQPPAQNQGQQNQGNEPAAQGKFLKMYRSRRW